MRIAREHGARIIHAVTGANGGEYSQNAVNDWILCLLPCEAIAEDLEASLLEWKTFAGEDEQVGYNISIREQCGTEWKFLDPELRLANYKKINWRETFPASAPNASTLGGYILRIPNRED
ncbi:MAG TPA: hypothetical protein VI685_19295 [Candidatus Angelobacter sp.]